MSMERDTKNELLKVMTEFEIHGLYEKFHENGVTIEVIWKLTDEILSDVLKLNSLEKLKYEIAKDKALHQNLEKVVRSGIKDIKAI